MLRRHFIANLGCLSVVAAAGSTAGRMYRQSRDLASEAVDKTARQISALSRRIEDVEDKQRKLTRALILTAAVSTGIDLSLII